MVIHKPLRVKSRHGYTLAAELHEPEGKGPFVVVLFAHGYGSSKDSKKGSLVSQALEDRYACLRFDYAGHGESGGAFEGTTVTRCVEDVEDILIHLRAMRDRRLDMGRIVMYGSSLGGAVSIVVASRHPEVKAMLLFAPASDFSIQEGACEEARSRGRSSIAMPSWRRGTIMIHCNLAEDGARHDFYALAKKIRCPALIFHGDADKVIPLGQSERLKKALAHAELQVVPGADHVFNDDRALCARLAAECRKFLDKHLK